MGKAVIRRSERLYSFLLRFYPQKYRQEFGKEMYYVFSQSLKDAYTEHGESGVISLWGRTIIDVAKSLVIQHKENHKGGESMKTKNAQNDMKKSIIRVLGIPALILMIPLIGMQVSSEWNWDMTDFIVIGVLLVGATLLYEVLSRMMRKQKLVIAIVIVLLVMYLWAELAVGIFTNWGS